MKVYNQASVQYTVEDIGGNMLLFEIPGKEVYATYQNIIPGQMDVACLCRITEDDFTEIDITNYVPHNPTIEQFGQAMEDYFSGRPKQYRSA